MDVSEILKNLSHTEKLDLYYQLRDELGDSMDEEAFVLTEEQKKILEERSAQFEKDPSSVLTWQQVLDRLSSK